MPNRFIVRSAFMGLIVLATVSGAQEKSVLQSARQIPVAYDVDVVVVGGSTGAVTAAVAAAEQGANRRSRPGRRRTQCGHEIAAPEEPSAYPCLPFPPGLRPFPPFIGRPAESILLTGNDRG